MVCHSLLCDVSAFFFFLKASPRIVFVQKISEFLSSSQDLLWFFLALHFSQLLSTVPVLHTWCTSPGWRHSQEQSSSTNKQTNKQKITSGGKKPVLVEFVLYSLRQDFLADRLQHLGTEGSWLRAGKLPLSTCSLKEIFLPLGGKVGGKEEWPYV